MKLTIALIFLGVIAATAQELTKSLQVGELDSKLQSEGDSNAKLPRKTERMKDEIVELGKRLRNVAAELKVVAKEQEGSDGGEDSSYFVGGLVIMLRGLIQLIRNVVATGRALHKFRQYDGEGYSTYGMEDHIPHLSQLYEFLAEKIDNLGEILEIAGAERAR